MSGAETTVLQTVVHIQNQKYFPPLTATVWVNNLPPFVPFRLDASTNSESGNYYMNYLYNNRITIECYELHYIPKTEQNS
jgi:hypothetical protein